MTLSQIPVLSAVTGVVLHAAKNNVKTANVKANLCFFFT